MYYHMSKWIGSQKISENQDRQLNDNTEFDIISKR